MRKIRIIGRLDIKGPNLIKGIRLEGLRVIGDPNKAAKKLYNQGVDELIYMDIVASLYERNSLEEIVRESARDIFIPLTVGGGIRKSDDVRKLLRAGADKVAVNTAAIKRPGLISELAKEYGSQCIVLSVEAKKVSEDKWEAYYDNGRERTGLDVVEWIEEGVKLGAGEVLLTSVDREGTRKGFDVELAKKISDKVNVPVVCSGGFGDVSDLVNVSKYGLVDGVAIADAFHYDRFSVGQIKKIALEAGVETRRQ